MHIHSLLDRDRSFADLESRAAIVGGATLLLFGTRRSMDACLIAAGQRATITRWRTVPTGAGWQDALAALAQTRRELADTFDGLTAYLRSPAKGVWKRRQTAMPNRTMSS
jgi:hypothetical protein